MGRKLVTKTISWQDWGTFYGTTMVCCGYENYDDLRRKLKEMKYKDWLSAIEGKEEFNSCHFSKWNKDGKTWSMLWMKDWKQDLEHYKILAHELLHAVHFCMPDFLDVLKEKEAVAYQHSYLFESIAKELNKNHK